MQTIKMRSVVAAVTGALLFGFGANAMADSTDDILNALIAKGVLTEEEGALLQKGREGEKAGAAKKPKVSEKDGAFSLSSGDGKNSIALTGRLHFDARANNIGEFGDSSVYPYGNDVDSKSGADHFDVRRARIGVKGRIGGIADYLLQANLVGSSTIDEAFIDVNKYEPFGLKFGKFKVPFGLEQQTSSNNIDFMERSYVDQNVPAKRLGAMVHGEFPGFTYQADAFQMNDSALSQKDKSISTAARVTTNFAEIMGNKDAVMHVGLAGYTSNYQLGTATSSNTSGDAETTTRGTVFGFTSGGRGLANAYRMQIAGQQPGSIGAGATNDCTTPSNGCLINSGWNVSSPNTSDVHADNVGLELIGAYNNFKFQGEYSKAQYEASTKGVGQISADVDTWYAEALWLITGEKYADSYKKGAFGAIKPKSEVNFDTGSGYGAWELGFRVDAFDVNNTKSSGSTKSRFQGSTSGLTTGKIDECNYGSNGSTAPAGGSCDGGAISYTAGLKWILNPNMLFKLNYTHTKFDDAFYPVDIGSKVSGVRTTDNLKSIDSEDLIMLRGQFMF